MLKFTWSWFRPHVSSCSVRALLPVCFPGSVLYLGRASRMTSVKAALWEGTMLPSPGLFLNVLPWPLLSHCARSSNWMNLLGLLRNVFELPPRDWKLLSYRAAASTKGTGFLWEGSTFGWSPRSVLFRKPAKDKAFKEKNPEYPTIFETKILGVHRVTVLFYLI